MFAQGLRLVAPSSSASHMQYQRGITGCFVQRKRAPALQRVQRQSTVVTLAKANTSQSSKPAQYQPSNAKDAIETGTRVLKEERNTDEAIRLYQVAMQMQPSEDEARAALYNLGCALAKQKRWKESADNIVRAINDYKLKLVVALKDDDLAALRDTREWIEALTEVKGGLSRAAKLDLRTEAKAPFRLPRLILFGTFFASASLGLIIITLRLIKALQGGPDAPDVTETVQNFGINSTAVVVLGALIYRDVTGKQREMKVTDREETLSRLQLDLGGDRVMPLIKFRGSVRPVILAGTKAFVDKAMRDAEPYQIELRKRGVSLIPIISDGITSKGAARKEKELDPTEKILALKKELGAKDGSVKGFDSKALTPVKKVAEEASEDDKKWKLQAHNAEEWVQWVVEQKEFSGKQTERLNCYVQVQLDGTVRGSGTGAPPWAKFLDDLPEMGSIRTMFTDNIGPSI